MSIIRGTDGQGRAQSLLGLSGSNQEGSRTLPETTMALSDVLMTGQPSQSTGTDGSNSPSDFKAVSTQSTLTGGLGEVKGRGRPFADAIHLDEDLITDTVGAIAIDFDGHIAAGSSSGGIGMKHRGRVGPAALVGIGTAVIPVDPEDEDGITVAAVTSGTGEHMATTMASQKCAERLYFCNRRGRGGLNITANEEESMDSFVKWDFMDHPGVKNSHSVGAIGVMAVKKTPYGYFLHFAHNTDSFALASMHSNEKEAKCVMSRIGDHSSVVQGGRKVRID